MLSNELTAATFYVINQDQDSFSVSLHFSKISYLARMEENTILSRQKDASLGRILLIREGYIK